LKEWVWEETMKDEKKWKKRLAGCAPARSCCFHSPGERREPGRRRPLFSRGPPGARLFKKEHIHTNLFNHGHTRAAEAQAAGRVRFLRGASKKKKKSAPIA
jgi:hypothetical protein